jgi:hypothetical protein
MLTASTLNLNILTQFSNQTSTLSTILPTALPYLSLNTKSLNTSANETNSTQIIINDEIIVMAIIIDSKGAINNVTLTVKVTPPGEEGFVVDDLVKEAQKVYNK